MFSKRPKSIGSDNFHLLLDIDAKCSAISSSLALFTTRLTSGFRMDLDNWKKILPLCNLSSISRSIHVDFDSETLSLISFVNFFLVTFDVPLALRYAIRPTILLFIQGAPKCLDYVRGYLELAFEQTVVKISARNSILLSFGSRRES